MVYVNISNEYFVRSPKSNRDFDFLAFPFQLPKTSVRVIKYKSTFQMCQNLWPELSFWPKYIH